MIQELLNMIQARKRDGLTGAVVIRDFVSRRIHPLKQRSNFGFEYLGTRDPSRSSPKELSEEEVLERVKHLLKDAMASACKVKQYCADHPPPAVSTLILNKLFLCCMVLLHSLLIFPMNV